MSDQEDRNIPILNNEQEGNMYNIKPRADLGYICQKHVVDHVTTKIVKCFYKCQKYFCWR